MRHATALRIGVALALLGCQPTSQRNPSASPAPTTAPILPSVAATPIPTTAPASPAPASAAPASCARSDPDPTRIAYADGGDLWLYDAIADRSRRLTDDGEARNEHSPAFVGGGCLAYMNGPTIELLDLASGASRHLVEETASIWQLAASPDGATVLYMQIDYDVDSTFRLKRVSIDGGAAEVLHTFNASLGRGGSSEDEVSIAWSPDGSTILVANTHEFTEKFPDGAIYLFDPDGNMLERWAGTHPRWSPDGRTIYYRGHADVAEQTWHARSVATGRTWELGIRPATNNLSVSPDGRRVAYDTSWFGDTPGRGTFLNGAPKVYIYSLESGEERLLQRGGLGALWISDTAILVTDARGDPPNCWCSWEGLGTVSRLTVQGDRNAVNLTSTLFDAAVHLGT